jgi:hypothetical protein
MCLRASQEIGRRVDTLLIHAVRASDHDLYFIGVERAADLILQSLVAFLKKPDHAAVPELVRCRAKRCEAPGSHAHRCGLRRGHRPHGCAFSHGPACGSLRGAPTGSAEWRDIVSAPSPGCPFCQSIRIVAIAVEGLRGELIAFRCDDCTKQWSEIAPEVKGRRERAVPTESQAP